jgi:hypothetical protein
MIVWRRVRSKSAAFVILLQNGRSLAFIRGFIFTQRRVGLKKVKLVIELFNLFGYKAR